MSFRTAFVSTLVAGFVLACSSAQAAKPRDLPTLASGAPAGIATLCAEMIEVLAIQPTAANPIIEAVFPGIGVILRLKEDASAAAVPGEFGTALGVIAGETIASVRRTPMHADLFTDVGEACAAAVETGEFVLPAGYPYPED